MLRPAAGQSRLLSDNASQSSLQETGFCRCQSPLRDGTFGLGMSRLVNQCCWPVLLETHMFCLFFHFHNKEKGPAGIQENTSLHVGLGLSTIISSDELLHLVKRRETSVSYVCVFSGKKKKKIHVSRSGYKKSWNYKTNPVGKFWLAYSIKAQWRWDCSARVASRSRPIATWGQACDWDQRCGLTNVPLLSVSPSVADEVIIAPSTTGP